MLKNLFFLIILLSFLSLSKADDLIYDNYDEDQYFKELIKDYLVEKNLWESDKLIKPDEIRKIFIDIINEGKEYKNQKLKNAFEEVINYFIDKYYKEKKEIKGKDLYELININEVHLKFDELIKNKINDKEENENDLDKQFDNMDIIGEPNLDF